MSNVNESIIYGLRYISDTRRFLCLHVQGENWLLCYTSAEDAHEKRASLALLDFVDIVAIPLRELPIDHICIDGQFYQPTWAYEAERNWKETIGLRQP